MFKKEKLHLTKKWDKIFPQEEDVAHKKITFHNHFGITLAADMYYPKNFAGKLPAIAVCGPYGAVKEQVSGLYAQQMAKRGFLTIAFDPSFCGESGGMPRYMNSPDINVEDFQAAVDFLVNCDQVDNQKIGIIGICGWGGFALQASSIDTRIKATATITMYDMSRVTANGYNDINDNEQARYNLRVNINNQRTIDYKNGFYLLAGGNPEKCPDDAPQFLKDYSAFYRHRGYHPRSLGSNNGFAVSTITSLLNTRLLYYAGEIRTPVLMIHGEKAHSRYFSEDAYKLLKGDNKELYIVPNAVHCDLYDNYKYLPFDKLNSFFKANLSKN